MSTSEYNTKTLLFELQLRVGSKRYLKILNEIILIINKTNMETKNNFYIISDNFQIDHLYLVLGLRMVEPSPLPHIS
jgi:hypothetical protein